MLRAVQIFFVFLWCFSNFVFADGASQSPQTSTQGQFINGAVAIVNTDVITAQELSDATDQAIDQAKTQNLTLPDRITIERQVLQGLIMQKIALELAKLNNITVSDDQVNAAIQQIAAQHQVTVTQMYQKLHANGVNLTGFKNNVRNQIIIQKLEQAAVGSSIIITPNEIDNYLANQSRTENANTQYHIEHILIALPSNPTANDYATIKQKAESVLAKINGGMSFSQAAMTYSDSSDALNGGDLGYRTLANVPAVFLPTITTMQIGQVSGLISSDSGYNIIKLLDKKGGAPEQAHYITEYHVQAILIKTSPIMSDAQAQAQLMRLREDISNGASFAKLAEANSQDPLSNQNGGDMGWISLTDINSVLATQIKALGVNTLSVPFQTTDGWYLIKVLGTKQVNDTTNYEREQAKQALFMMKANEALQSWQSLIRGGSYIKILDPNLALPNS
jgi:peptidyl-prolyl cis-trans isomerase SurA